MFNIDWEMISHQLSMDPNQNITFDPEPIIHELVHAYDYDGESAFSYVGNQSVVNKRIQGKYSIDRDSDLSEIKTNVITTLVLKYLTGSDSRSEIIYDIRGNLKSTDYHIGLIFDNMLLDESNNTTARLISDRLITM